jgi:hypothetical protein
MTTFPKLIVINIDNGLMNVMSMLPSLILLLMKQSDNFVDKHRLKDFIDTVIESKKAKVKCKQCGADNDVSELLYSQYGAGTGIKRQLTCERGAILYDVGVVSFKLREGAKLPDGITCTIGDSIYQK